MTTFRKTALGAFVIAAIVFAAFDIIEIDGTRVKCDGCGADPTIGSVPGATFQDNTNMEGGKCHWEGSGPTRDCEQENPCKITGTLTVTDNGANLRSFSRAWDRIAPNQWQLDFGNSANPTRVGCDKEKKYTFKYDDDEGNTQTHTVTFKCKKCDVTELRQQPPGGGTPVGN